MSDTPNTNTNTTNPDSDSNATIGNQSINLMESYRPTDFQTNDNESNTTKDTTESTNDTKDLLSSIQKKTEQFKNIDSNDDDDDDDNDNVADDDITDQPTTLVSDSLTKEHTKTPKEVVDQFSAPKVNNGPAKDENSIPANPPKKSEKPSDSENSNKVIGSNLNPAKNASVPLTKLSASTPSKRPNASAKSNNPSSPKTPKNAPKTTTTTTTTTNNANSENAQPLELIKDLRGLMRQYLSDNVVDIILWEDKKVTSGVLGVMVSFLVLLLLGYPLLFLVTYGMLITCTVSFVIVNVSYLFHHYSSKKSDEPWVSPVTQQLRGFNEFEVTRADMSDFHTKVADVINGLIDFVRDAVLVKTNVHAMKMITMLFLATFVTRFSVPAILLLDVVLLFTVPFAYLQQKERLDNTVGLAVFKFNELWSKTIERIPTAQKTPGPKKQFKAKKID